MTRRSWARWRGWAARGRSMRRWRRGISSNRRRRKRRRSSAFRRFRPAGKSVAILGAGVAGLVRRLRARPRRLRLRHPRSLAAARRPQPDAAARRCLRRDRRTAAGVPLRARACGSTPGPAASRITTFMSSTIAAGSASRCSPTSSPAAPTWCIPATSATAGRCRCAAPLTTCRATSPSCSTSAPPSRGSTCRSPATISRRFATCWRSSAI